MVATAPRKAGFGDGLLRKTADPGDPNRLFPGGGVAFVNRFAGELKDRLEKGMAALPDRKLSRVHTDGNAAGTCSVVIARQPSLTAFVQVPLRRQGQRMGRDDLAGA